MTQKEAVLALLRGEDPGMLVNGWEPFMLVFDDLLMHTSPSLPGTVVKDCWGVTMEWELGQPGVMPSEDPDLLVCDDITEWKEQVTVPDVDSWELDWGSAFGQKAGAEAQGKFALGFMPCGVFELTHNILGFEEALVDFLIEPEDMQDLVDTIFEVKMASVKRQAEAWHPDGILFHDDFGSKDSLLLPPNTWREFFKEGYRKLFKLCHDYGMFVMLHSDSNNNLIAADLEEIGVDIWQGALPTADIAQLQKDLPGNMIFMGGFDAGAIDRPDSTPEEIRAEVERALAEYAPGGKFIPCITYGGPGSIHKGVDDQITAIIEEYNNK